MSDGTHASAMETRSQDCVAGSDWLLDTELWDISVSQHWRLITSDGHL